MLEIGQDIVAHLYQHHSRQMVFEWFVKNTAHKNRFLQNTEKIAVSAWLIVVNLAY